MTDDERDELRPLVARKPGEATWTGESFLTVEWNATDMWNLDGVFADIISDGLDEFRRARKETQPDGLTYDEWDAVLLEMIDGFQAVREARSGGVLGDEARAHLDRALNLFKKHFLDLGW